MPRGRRGDLPTSLWHDGLGTSLYAKRLRPGDTVAVALVANKPTNSVHVTVVVTCLIMEVDTGTPPPLY